MVPQQARSLCSYRRFEQSWRRRRCIGARPGARDAALQRCPCKVVMATFLNSYGDPFVGRPPSRATKHRKAASKDRVVDANRGAAVMASRGSAFLRAFGDWLSHFSRAS